MTYRKPQLQSAVEGYPPTPPFIDIHGLPNFRDCGGYPIADRPGEMIRNGIIYRSADPSKITETGIDQLRDLGIAKVFDLRSDREIDESTKRGWGQVKVWAPAARIAAPVFMDSDYENGHRAQRDKNLRMDGHEGFIQYYRDVLASAMSPDNAAQPFKTILAHLAREHPSPEPILIHCSLGKDRTGVICALILSICGVEDKVVAYEYALTALGLQNKIAQIIAEIRPDGPKMSDEERRFFGSRQEAMQGFLAWIHQSGGWEKYVTEPGILTSQQLKQLRENLTVESSIKELL